MKHVTVVCLAQDRQTAVEGLRDLETVHVTDCMPPSGEALDVLTRRSDALNRAVALLASREPAAQEDEGRSPAGVIEDVLAQAGEIVHLREKHTRLQRGLSQLAPWGSFSLDSIAELTASGLRVVLSTAREGEMPEVPDGAVLHVVSVKDKTVYFAVVAPEDVQLDLSGAALPEETNIEALHADLVECEQEMAACEAKLDVLAVAFPRLKEAQTVLADEVAFVRAREGMGADEKLVYLQGFVPERDMAALLGRAKNNGWAVRTEDVADDDPSVPVKITLPPMFRVAKPIFDFVGILPGYDENDVSVSVLVFLTLFFGMIVGDAGYGTIFLALALFAKAKIKAPDKQLILNLFILLSVVTVVWGWMTGNWFAIAAKRLPAFMHGIPVLTDASIRDKNVQWLCFLIAGIHLSMAHVWRAFVNLNRRRVALGHIGWGFLIWGNFYTAVELIVFPGSFPKFAIGLYAVGVLLILVFGVNWKDVGGVMNLPFDFINSFVDVLSYIRLFAVGLSSYFIASSFNGMGGMVMDLSPWLAPAAVLIIVFGHLLNVALAFMGVLVHGIRLNTLEFSNHMELTWSGRPYNPLKQTKTQS